MNSWDIIFVVGERHRPYRVPSKSTPRSKGTNRQLRSEEFSGLGEFQRAIYQWPGNESRAIEKTHTEEYTLCVGKDQRKAFEELKNSLTDVNTLAYFNPAFKTRVVADASPVGPGAVLLLH